MTDYSTSSTLRVRAQSKRSANDIHARLVALEGANRRWRQGFVVTGALLAVALLSGAALRPAVPDLLAAQQFSLVDEAGNVRGQWRIADSGPEFASFAADGALVGVLSVTGGGVTAPAPLPRPNAAGGNAVIKIGQPDDVAEDDDSFDWAD